MYTVLQIVLNMNGGWEALQAKPGDAQHPAEIDEQSFMRRAELIRTGIKSAYELNLDDIHLPPTAIRGRVNAPGYFTGKVDSATGQMRVDHSVDHAFWLEVDLQPLMQAYLAHKFRPSGPESSALLANWQAAVAADMLQAQQARHADTPAETGTS